MLSERTVVIDNKDFWQAAPNSSFSPAVHRRLCQDACLFNSIPLKVCFNAELIFFPRQHIEVKS